MANDNKLGFLNLKNHGDTATIRVLHSTPDTIEVENTHWINFSDGTHKSVKCVGDGCPLCASKVSVNKRAYVHVLDLGDMQEKVWVRPVSMVDELRKGFDYYKTLTGLNLVIQRDNSGQYPVQRIINATETNAPLNNDLVDKKVAYRCFVSRTVEELQQFLTTGQMPEHKKNFVPKEQYKANKQSHAPQNAQNAPYSPFGGQGGTPTPVQPKMAPTPTPAAPVAQPTWTYNPTQTVAPTATPVASMTPPTWTGNTITPTPTPTTFPPQAAPANDDPFSSPIFRV